MKLRRLVMASLFGFSLLAAAACEREGPMERAGEKVDEAAERAGDKVEDATRK